MPRDDHFSFVSTSCPSSSPSSSCYCSCSTSCSSCSSSPSSSSPRLMNSRRNTFTNAHRSKALTPANRVTNRDRVTKQFLAWNGGLLSRSLRGIETDTSRIMYSHGTVRAHARRTGRARELPEAFVRVCTPEQWLAKASDIRAITTKRSFPRRAIIKDISAPELTAGSRRKSSLYERTRGGEGL